MPAMTKLLAHSWIAAPLGAVVYLVATVLFWQKPIPPAREKLAELVNAIGPSWDFNNPEADLLITELKLEKKAVEQRQQQLDDLATRLNTERAEVGQVIQSVRKLQAEFDKAVLRVKDDEKDNLKKLAKLYGAMSPDVAASVLEQLDNEAIVKIMLFLKNEETAAILEAIAKKGDAESRRTAQISEQIRLSSHSPTPK
jgi:flagellar motility protein MotE (MotC chaperone)